MHEEDYNEDLAQLSSENPYDYLLANLILENFEEPMTDADLFLARTIMEEE